MSKFGFKGLPIVPSTAKFAGSIVERYGYDRNVIPALFAKDDSHVYEYGEVVEIVGDTRTNYVVQAVTDDTAATANLGIILRQRDGKTDIKGGLLEKGERNVALSVWVIRDNKGSVAVPILGGLALVEKGGAVHLGTGLQGTIAGAVYGEEVSNDGTVELTGIIMRGLPTKPYTNTDIGTVAIGVKVA